MYLASIERCLYFLSIAWKIAEIDNEDQEEWIKSTKINSKDDDQNDTTWPI